MGYVSGDVGSDDQNTLNLAVDRGLGGRRVRHRILLSREGYFWRDGRTTDTPMGCVRLSAIDVSRVMPSGLGKPDSPLQRRPARWLKFGLFSPNFRP